MIIANIAFDLTAFNVCFGFIVESKIISVFIRPNWFSCPFRKVIILTSLDSEKRAIYSYCYFDL